MACACVAESEPVGQEARRVGAQPEDKRCKDTGSEGGHNAVRMHNAVLWRHSRASSAWMRGALAMRADGVQPAAVPSCRNQVGSTHDMPCPCMHESGSHAGRHHADATSTSLCSFRNALTCCDCPGALPGPVPDHLPRRPWAWRGPTAWCAWCSRLRTPSLPDGTARARKQMAPWQPGCAACWPACWTPWPRPTQVWGGVLWTVRGMVRVSSSPGSTSGVPFPGAASPMPL